MGGPNLEVFKFATYIAFPIGMMYYFGTNLDSRFSVPDFWPKDTQTHKIPFERDEIEAELERLRQRRLEARARRLALESQGVNTEVTVNQEAQAQKEREGAVTGILDQVKVVEPEKSQVARTTSKSWFGWLG